MNAVLARRRSLVGAFALVAAVAALAPRTAIAAADPYMPDQYALRQIAAPAAWQASTGAGVIIAVVDSGVDASHEDLAGKVIGGRDFVDGDDNPADLHGHGTIVAGIASAVTGNGKGMAGTAPDARILPVRVINGTIREDQEKPCRAAEGVRWAADQGAKVINLSLTTGVDAVRYLFSCGIETAMNYAWNHGSLVVAASGNDESAASSQPSDYPPGVKAMIVTAVDADGHQPAYANQADTAWSLAAPGDEVLSIAPGNRYVIASGTSMAAPHVSGVAALLFAQGLSNTQVVDRLLATARPMAGTVNTGSGLVDAAAAVGAPTAPVPTPAPPTTRPPATQPRSTTAPGTAAPSPVPSAVAPATTAPLPTKPELAVPAIARTPFPSVVGVAGQGQAADESSSRTWPAVTAGALVLGAATGLTRSRRRQRGT